MNEEMKRVSEFAKKLVAAGLFLVLLTGGAAAVLSVLAAGLNTLSARPSAPVQQVTSAQSGTLQNGNGSASGYSGSNSGYGSSAGSGNGSAQGSLSGTGSGSGGSSASPSGTGVLQSGETQAVTMTSPVGEALDKGGVVVGQQVQQAFGNVLSNMIRVLFVERPETYSTSSASSQTSSGTGASLGQTSSGAGASSSQTTSGQGQPSSSQP